VPYAIDRKKLASMGGRNTPRFNAGPARSRFVADPLLFAMFLKREDGD
jgi:hypothetical protein